MLTTNDHIGPPDGIRVLGSKELKFSLKPKISILNCFHIVIPPKCFMTTQLGLQGDLLLYS